MRGVGRRCLSSAEVAARVDLLLRSAPPHVLVGGGLCPPGGRVGALVVEPLTFAARRGSERVGDGYRVAVAVGGDGADLLLPGRSPGGIGGSRSEPPYPRLALLDGLAGWPPPLGVSDVEWAAMVTARRRDLIGALTETVLGRPLSPVEHTAVDIALNAAVSSWRTPILPMVVDRILNPDAGSDARLAEDGRIVGHALRRLVAGDLAGIFDGPSTVAFDPDLPMVSLDLSRVAENNALISVLMTCASAWMESALLDPNGGQRWVIYDEAWQLMQHPALLRRMDAHWRLARYLGIANMLIFHKLTDLDNVGDQGTAAHALASSLLANAETRIIYRQESDQLGTTAAMLNLTGTEQKMLPQLGTGQGLWRIKDRSFVVQHQLHPAELTMFDTTARMRDSTGQR